MPFELVQPALSDFRDVRQACRRKYWGHRDGCPNWNTRGTCPPKAPLLWDVLDVERPVVAIWNCFDLAAHVARQRVKHPDWQARQLKNLRHWQPTARKALKEEVARVLQGLDLPLVVCGTPEACGVNLTATMASIGIELEWPPVSKAYQIVLAGFPVSGGHGTGLRR